MATEQKRRAIEILNQCLAAPRNKVGQTPFEVQPELDQERIALIDGELKPLPPASYWRIAREVSHLGEATSAKNLNAAALQAASHLRRFAGQSLVNRLCSVVRSISVFPHRGFS